MKAPLVALTQLSLAVLVKNIKSIDTNSRYKLTTFAFSVRRLVLNILNGYIFISKPDNIIIVVC